MPAITWRNVDRPALSEAMRPLLGAQQSFNASFDTLGQMLNRTEQVGNNNVAVGNEVAKQQYLTMLDSAKTPEELAALQKTEQFQNAFNTLNAAAQGQVRTADDARLTALRSQVTQGQDYATGQTAFAQKALRDQVAGEVAMGTATPERIKEAGLDNSAPLYAALRQGQIGEQDRKLKQQQFGLQVNQDTRAGAEENRKAGMYAGQLSLQAAQVTDTQNKLADSAVVRGVDALVQADSAAHQKYVAENGDVINNIATEMGLPTKEGRLNINALTGPQKAQLNERLTTQGLPLVDDVFGADTKNMALTLQKVREQYGPAGVARATQIAPGMYSSSPVGKIGRDADAAEYNSAKYKTDLEEKQAQYTGISSPSSINTLIKAAAPMVAEVTKERGHEGRASEYMDALTKALKENSIKIGKGDNAREILPSADALYGIIRSVKPAFWSSASTEMEDAFKAWAESNAKGAAELYDTTDRAKARKLDEVKAK